MIEEAKPATDQEINRAQKWVDSAISKACYACGNVIGGISEYGKKQTDCSYGAAGIKGIGLVQFCSKECCDKTADSAMIGPDEVRSLIARINAERAARLAAEARVKALEKLLDDLDMYLDGPVPWNGDGRLIAEIIRKCRAQGEGVTDG